MLLGGLAHSLTAQGFGGVLGQLTSAAEAARPARRGAGSGGDCCMASLVGNLFGGGQSGQAASASPRRG